MFVSTPSSTSTHTEAFARHPGHAHAVQVVLQLEVLNRLTGIAVEHRVLDLPVQAVYESDPVGILGTVAQADVVVLAHHQVCFIDAVSADDIESTGRDDRAAREAQLCGIPGHLLVCADRPQPSSEISSVLVLYSSTNSLPSSDPVGIGEQFVDLDRQLPRHTDHGDSLGVGGTGGRLIREDKVITGPIRVSPRRWRARVPGRLQGRP